MKSNLKFYGIIALLVIIVSFIQGRSDESLGNLAMLYLLIAPTFTLGLYYNYKSNGEVSRHKSYLLYITVAILYFASLRLFDFAEAKAFVYIGLVVMLFPIIGVFLLRFFRNFTNK